MTHRWIIRPEIACALNAGHIQIREKQQTNSQNPREQRKEEKKNKEKDKCRMVMFEGVVVGKGSGTHG